MNTKLELRNWEICGYFPYIPQLGMQAKRLGRGVTNWVPAKVPGSVHNDLYEAGIIEDPYFGINSLKCEWVENRWWAYKTTFDFQAENDRRYVLNFKGLDYKCWVYINNAFITIHEGSFTTLEIDITSKLKNNDNEIFVLFESAPDEDSQAGRCSNTKTQKSRFSYKWDFSTRMVPVGIWDDVYIETRGNCQIDDVWIKPIICENEKGLVEIKLNTSFIDFEKIETFEAKAKIFFEGKEVGAFTKVYNVKEENHYAKIDIEVGNIKRWYSNGLGEQPLYDVKIEVFLNNRVSHSWNGRIGFSDVKWIQNENSPQNALPYTLFMNGKKVYIKGVNLTPFDMLIGTVSDKKYRRFLQQIKDANINLVRVNGVGLIEKEIFYNICDEMGLLVWQEFIQTSSSMDRTPPTNKEYLELLRITSESAIKTKRNHTCLVCYSGGNELTDAPTVTATYENPNIKFLSDLIDKYDTGRHFFPTSASGPKEFLNYNEVRGESHDVHGPWNYEGPERHYELFNGSDSLFHGELGSEGMSHIDSLRKFLSEEDLVVTSMEDNLVWRHHGDWWDTYKRDTNLFGKIPNLQTFIDMSMFIQGEAIRYSLESNRRRKYQNSGSLMWAFNEPYPNVSNTCLVDYYGVPKMSYYSSRDAYSPLHISLAYKKINYSKGEVFMAKPSIHNSLDDKRVKWSIEILDLEGKKLHVFDGEDHVGENSTLELQEISFTLDKTYPNVFMARLRVNDKDGMFSINEYLFGTSSEKPFESLLDVKDVDLEFKIESIDNDTEKGVTKAYCKVRNKGKNTALFVYPYLKNGNEFLFSPQSHKSLLPNETRSFEVISYKGECLENIEFRYFFEVC